MAGTFRVAFQTSGAGAGTAFAMLQNTGAVGKPKMRLLELGITTNAATLSQIGLIRAATVGTPSGTALVGQPDDDSDTTAPVGQVVTSWSAQPTIAGTPVYLNELVAAAVQGSGTIWTFPSDRPIVVSPAATGVTGGLLLWNFGAGAASALSCYAVWGE